MKRVKKKKDKLIVSKTEIIKLDYNTYIKSPEWFTKREEAFETHGRICKKCQTKDNLHVHHMTYDRLFKEDIKKDLTILCRPCHYKYHDLVKFTTIKKTKDFINNTLKPDVDCNKWSTINEKNKKRGKTISVTSFENKFTKTHFKNLKNEYYKAKLEKKKSKARKIFDYQNKEPFVVTQQTKDNAKKKQDEERTGNLKRMLLKGQITQEYYNSKININ